MMQKWQDLVMRVQPVLETIYLISNEAYSASKGNDIIRFDLCQEAIRLAQMLENEKTIKQKGNIYALLSLIFLNASRFKARQDQEGNLLSMAEQNRLLWDRKRQDSGFEYLQKATENPGTRTYFILAAISANYCLAPDYNSTNWENILVLYDSLVELDHSPVVLLNRAIVLSKIAGAEKGLHELELLKNEPQIKSYHLFYSTQAEFFIEMGEHEMAIHSLQEAAELAPLESIRDLLKKKIGFCKEKISFDSSF